MFAAAVGTFLVSKEIWVLEHEFYCGVGMFIVLSGIVKAVGPGVSKFLDAEVDAQEAELRAIRQDEIDRCKAALAEEEEGQWMATSYKELLAVKQENVAMQYEIEYRQRLAEAYKQVSCKLSSYLVR